MLTFNSSEDNTDHIENFVRFGINVTGLKAKLAKKTYFLILLTNSLILLFSLIYLNSKNFQNCLSDMFNNNYLYIIIIGSILLISILALKSSENYLQNFLLYIIWFFWLVYISILICFVFSFIDNFGYIYIIFFIHHFIVSVILVFKNEFNFSIIWINFILGIFGIIFICVQKFWVISHFYFYILICFQLFFVNIFYFLLIQFFNYYQEKSFWKKRSALIFFLIFLLGNLTLLCLFVVIFYLVCYVCKNKGKQDYYYDKEESEINVDTYFQQRD